MKYEPGSIIIEVENNRRLEAEIAELERHIERLSSGISPPRAARLRELKLAAAYRVVIADLQRTGARFPKMRRKTFEASERLLKHRAAFFSDDSQCGGGQ